MSNRLQMMAIQRLPDWLLEDTSFMITFSPRVREPIVVMLDNVFMGRGYSIAEAAKEARKKREQFHLAQQAQDVEAIAKKYGHKKIFSKKDLTATTT